MTAAVIDTVEGVASVLTSFLFWAVLLWLIAFVWFRRGIKGKRRLRAGLLAFLSWKLALALYVTAVPMQGQLVQAETGKPVSGALVVGAWVGSPGIVVLSCWGSRWERTDSQGRFRFSLAPALSMIHYKGEIAEVRFPGRYTAVSHAIFPRRPATEYSVQKYVAGHEYPQKVFNEHYCGVSNGVPYGTDGTYRALYQSACIDREPWTATNRYFYDLADAWKWEWRQAKGEYGDPRHLQVRATSKRLPDAHVPGDGVFYPSAVTSDIVARECAILAAPVEFRNST